MRAQAIMRNILLALLALCFGAATAAKQALDDRSIRVAVRARGVWRVPIHSFRKRMLGGRHELGRRTTATFVPKFPRLPPEFVRRVAEYAFHAGDY